MTRAVAAALALTCAAPAFAGFPVESEETCPVGGETFTYTTTGSYSIFGQRPDGKPFGSWEFPLALPVCPTNGLVVYREFKPEEIAALTALVASPEYQALREETPYFRAAWLAQRMDAVDPANLGSLFLRYRLANAYRELGEFARADAALASLPLAALDVAVPGGDDASDQARRDANSRRFLLDAIPMMRRVIAARDTSPDPLELMGDDYAAARCADMIEADPAAPLPARCTDPAIRKAAEEFVKRRSARADESPAEAAMGD